jgi:hypothetical protein
MHNDLQSDGTRAQRAGSSLSERETLLELHPDDGALLRLSPTDIAQYIGLAQCRRYLRLRLLDRNAGSAFMRAWDVQPQSIPPLLTRAGREFEEGAETAIDRVAPTVKCTQAGHAAPGVDSHNQQLIDTARSLAPGGRVVVFQPRLRAEIDGWDLTGVADAIDFRRSGDGTLSAFIIDFKSTTSARMEHRLQIAFYDEMLRAIFAAEDTPLDVELGILYRGTPGDGARSDDPALIAQLDDAIETFGIDGYLERIEDPAALRRDVRSLVLDEKSEAHRNLAMPFEQLPYNLNFVCDGCLYQQLCLRQSAETDDLSLIPFMQPAQKQSLHLAKIRHCADLATVPLPAESKSTEYRKLAMAPALGAGLDDLIARARTYRASKGDPWKKDTWLHDPGQSSIPRCDTEFHPNLIKVYIDVEHDYQHDRVYLLSALIVGAENGQTSPERRRTIVELAPGPPDDHDIEAALLRIWLEKTIAAIAEVAAPDAEGNLSAPIHLFFYDAYDQRVLMNALARHLGQVFGATSLYDFVSQLAAYTSPILTVLADEVRAQRNFPLLCQSLQSLSRYLKFPWNAERSLTTTFYERYFDVAGKFAEDDIPEGDTDPWFTRRARFSSQLPLEYAYAAWNQLPPPDDPDLFEPFRQTTSDDLRALHHRRLDAIELIAGTLKPNKWATKASFDLSNLADFDDISTSFAMALDEFITIERHIALGAWKHDRAMSPERRVLSGASMLARYHEEDQSPEMAQFNRELYEFDRLPPEEQEGQLKPNKPEGPWRLRLRIDLSAVETSVEHAMSLWNAGIGDRMVISPRKTVDTRLPVAERVPFTPTVRQLLYGASAGIVDTGNGVDSLGNPYTWIDVDMGSFGAKSTEFVFNQMYKGFESGALLTLDESPNDWYGSLQRGVVTGLREGKRNALFQRITEYGPEQLEPDPAAVDGQARFLQGLRALEAAGLLHGFEPSKHRLIGDLAEAPTLLVQGPPGTGKSLTASYAILARIQGAMAADRDCRVIIACKTHAAVDELMRKLVEVIDELAAIRAKHTGQWDEWFDVRLLSLPIFRYEGKEGAPAGVIPLDRHQKGDDRTDKQIEAAPHCVIAAGLAGVYRIAKERSTRKISIFDYRYCDLLVLDEASQINLPEAIMGALALKDDGQLIVIGDHRQMPPIVQNDWEREVRRTFVTFRSYESLFLTLRNILPEEHQIRFQESFRVHADIAEFLRKQIYKQDGIDYFSQKTALLPPIATDDPFVAAVLDPSHPLTVVVHEEMESQQRNRFEQQLMQPVLETLAQNGFDPQTGLGVVVPHTAQRAALRSEIPELTQTDPETGAVIRYAVDTVERFQGAERVAIVVGATESDPLYLLANSRFLLDPRRINVAISRAKSKLVLVSSRAIFDLFPTDEDVFASAQLWKNLLADTCTQRLWSGSFEGIPVQVWGNVSSLSS